MPDFDFAPWTV